MSEPLTARQAAFVALADQLAGPIAARADAVDRENTFPAASFAELQAGGYLRLTVPERYGGLGANLLEYAIAQERIGRACGATGLASSMHLSLVGRTGERQLWPEATYASLCRAVVEDGALINAVNSEPSLGSPSRGALPTTTATRTATGWRIDGHKRWASLAPALTHIYSLATIIDENEPRRGNFLIPASSPGVRVERTWDNLGMRGTASEDIIFTGVEVPASALLPAEPPGDPGAWTIIPSGAVYLGIAQAAQDEAVRFAHARRPNGMSGSIADLPGIQQLIARMEIALLTARTLLRDVARAWAERPEARGSLGSELLAVKFTVNQTVLEVTDLALRVAGAAGLRADSPLQRYFRDARTALGHPPMEDVVLTVIGKNVLARGLGPGEDPSASPAPATA